jgi:hypothetical protein
MSDKLPLLDPVKLKFLPRTCLAGKSFGVKYDNDDRVFVSPAAHSLIKSDFHAMMKSLRVRRILGDPIMDGEIIVGL